MSTYKKFFVLLSALVMFGLNAGQVQANTIYMTPDPAFQPGDTSLDVKIIGDFTTGVESGQFRFFWDPLVIDFVSTSLISTPLFGSIPDASTAPLGYIDYVGFYNADPSPTAPPVTGTYELATVTFNVVGGPSSNFSFGDLGWYDSNLGLVDTQYIDGQVTVSAVPVPAALWLMLSGLLGIIGVARRRS